VYPLAEAIEGLRSIGTYSRSKRWSRTTTR
jgi:hypothetical protein